MLSSIRDKLINQYYCWYRLYTKVGYPHRENNSEAMYALVLDLDCSHTFVLYWDPHICSKLLYQEKISVENKRFQVP